jgi:hypothetical protein
MVPWLIVLLVVAALAALGWGVDAVARRKRRGLTSLAGPCAGTADPAAVAERIRPGVATETQPPRGDLPSS